jgi:hypothetical protein
MTLSHLDDDALSAALDGEATAEEQSHLTGCAACQARLATFRAVAQAVGAPVPPRPAAAVNSAIQLAVDDAWTAESVTGDEVVTVVATANAAQVGAGPSGSRRPGRDRLRFGGRPQRVVAMAAAIVVVLGTVGGLLGLLGRGSGKSASTSLGVSRPQSAQPAAPTSSFSQSRDQVKGVNPGAAPSGAAGPAPVSGFSVRQGPDLGAQSDPAVVARLVDGQLNAGGEAVPAAGSSANSRTAPATLPCVEQGATAAALPGQQADLVYAATVRWRGDDSVVLVYLRPGGRRAGVVMRLSDCSRLAVLPV